MKKIKIYDNSFSHAKYLTDFQQSQYFEWTRGDDHTESACFFTDNFLGVNPSPLGQTHALLIEPKSINPNTYAYIQKNNKKFDRVLTYEKELLDLGENFSFYPHGGCWIAPEDQRVYKKSKECSIIASKKAQTTGHRLRHEVIAKAKKIDVFGRGYSPLEYKVEGLRDYRFSVVIENCKRDYYFTEKLIDCFMTGTVPIYWGCPSIGEFFDTRGMILFDSADEAREIIESLDKELYHSKEKFVKKNFNKAKEYIIPEDWIYRNIL